MVDFKKKLVEKQGERKVHPVEIYQTLDRKSVAGPLRPAQVEILNKWYDARREDKDLIVKLHTGEGKTLIGLLILQSRINSSNEKCMFVCPNKQLVEQVKAEAAKFGIGLCEVEADNAFPNDFTNGKKILVTHVQKLFNGKTIFGLLNKSMPVDNVILDDSHACIDAIRSSFTVRVLKTEALYRELLALFAEDLVTQGAGTLLEIQQGSPDALLPVPYWNWIDRSSEVLQLLLRHVDQPYVKFAWPLIKDSLENCHCFFTGSEVEISPHYIPVSMFGSFASARQRVLMSATTQDDSFFIKGLGFGIDAVLKPLSSETPKWSGEKMLLIPWLIDESIERDTVIAQFAKPSHKRYGVVALVSSYRKSEDYETYDSKVARPGEILALIESLKKGNFDSTLVIVNRYDGIDLPDEACRILIIDGLPFSISLIDRYEESCRASSDTMNIRLAQRIEQGLGRSVRGEKDYCCIILIGGDLVKFIRSGQTNKYFSPQTRKQIEIGLEIAKMAESDIDKARQPFDVIRSLIGQSLDRDEGWKEYYVSSMDSITEHQAPSTIYSLLEAERKAEEYAHAGKHDRSCEILQTIADSSDLSDAEKGWYLQLQARHKHWLSKAESNQLQLAAYSRNLRLLKPREGVSYRKVEAIASTRLERIRTYAKRHGSYTELMLAVDSMVANLSFGTPADKFEGAMKELGSALGFISQRPDNEFKEGPDNLWYCEPSDYLIFECKSDVKEDREEIIKDEGGQMNTHCAWFEEKYGGIPVSRFMVIVTRKLGRATHFTHDVRIVKKGKLKSLKTNVQAFFKEFREYDFDALSDAKLQEWIDVHKLKPAQLKEDYSEAPVKYHG